MEIKVLGTSCTKCENLEQQVRNTVEKMDIEANIEKVDDIYKIMQYGVMRTPGLVIDGTVVLSGRLPKAGELEELLTK